jgi:multidrug efflux system outer membrane protein
VLAIFTGCNFAPKYQRPPLPVSNQYPLESTNTDAVATASTEWQSYFADERLRSLITEALQQNRDLRIAVSRVEEARSYYRVTRADLLPTIYAGGDYTRGRTPADLSITGRPLTASEYRIGFSTSAWEVDFWGRIRNLKAAALENFLATDAARRAFTISLVADIADTYLRIRELDERIGIARETTATRQESFRIYSRRYEEGSTSRFDLTQVETLLMQAQVLTAELEQSRATAANFLTQLVGAPGLVPAEKTFEDANVLQPLRVGLPSDLLHQRPDIVAAEHQLRAAHANIGAARAAFFPRVVLVGAAGTATAEFEDLFNGAQRAWSFGPSISVPIFDYGRNRGNLSLAEARKVGAVADYEKRIQVAFREVADALAGQKWLSDQVRILRQTVAVQSERARLAKLQYDNGTVTFLEVLDAQRGLLDVQQQFIEARRALLSSGVQLYAALGGGEQGTNDQKLITKNSKPSERD